MAGTMSEKELRISCGITLGAEVKSLLRNTNASAMALREYSVSGESTCKWKWKDGL